MIGEAKKEGAEGLEAEVEVGAGEEDEAGEEEEEEETNLAQDSDSLVEVDRGGGEEDRWEVGGREGEEGKDNIYIFRK